ncbi:MAG: lysylphosphatidylglycerol synthase domain-containing protein [Gemmatimonadota bacterium]|nr:lysylphosphatidylglycerol synthase domain-containing protein [Gemmatimonadota bacterium]
MSGTPAEPRRASRRLRLGGWAFVVLSLAFLGALWARQGGELGRLRADLAAAGWRLRPGWALASLGPGILSLFVMGRVWVGIFRRLGGSCGTAEGIRVWMTTNLGRYVPGKVWQLAGLAAYMRERRGAGAAALAAAALFQVLVLGTGAAVALASLGGTPGGAWMRVGAAALVVAGLGLLLRPAPAVRLARLLARRFGEGETAALARSGPRALWSGGAALVAAWLLQGVGLWLLWRGVGGPADPGPWRFAGLFAAAYLAGYLALFAPGGLVVREGALAGLLVATGPVSLAPAAAFAAVARLWSTAAELGALGVAWLPRAGGRAETSRRIDGGPPDTGGGRGPSETADERK